MTPEEARQRAAEKRASFFESVEAVQKKVGAEAERVDVVVTEAQKLKSGADTLVRAHPWLFVLGALALGVALGSRPRRRGSARDGGGGGGIVETVADGIAAHVGRAIERMLFQAFDELKNRFLETKKPNQDGPS
ncbi:MAG: hypothetical protein HYV07_30745 [Deltaproteobacteria bacterium]|nr:hypothetical protein [Deltaproteobacteria bacterium]